MKKSEHISPASSISSEQDTLLLFSRHENQQHIYENIVPTDDIRDLLEYTSDNNMFVIDLENTVFETSQSLGSIEWYTQYKRISPTNALQSYELIQSMSKVKPVQIDMTATTIQSLQAKSQLVLAITHRRPEIKLVTEKQLSSIGIDFNHGLFKHATMPLANGAYINAGILYAAGRDHGLCLLEFLTNIFLKPKTIVHISSYRPHLEQMKVAAECNDIAYLGFIHNKLHHKIEDFDLKLANVQLYILKEKQKLISDEDAAAYLAPKLTPPFCPS